MTCSSVPKPFVDLIAETWANLNIKVDLTVPLKPTTLDWRALDWRPGEDEQAKPRVKREKYKIDFKDMLLDQVTMDNYVNKYLLQKQPDFGQGYTGRPMNFVEAFVVALDRTPHYSLGEIVEPHYRNEEWAIDWIFGPCCETTSFAKVNAIQSALKGSQFMVQMRRFAQGSETPIVIEVQGVSFIVTPLVHSPYGFLHPHDLDKAEYHVRFASYQDYDTWAEMASHDHTLVEVRGLG